MTNFQPSFSLPAARSAHATNVDATYMALVWMSVLMFVLVVGAAFYFAYRYRRKQGDTEKLSSPTFHSTSLELFWAIGPLLVCLGFFHWGVKQYMDARVAPSDSMEVRVRGQKWFWEFEYANGKIATELHVPAHKPVKLIMTSKDVIHSFFIPNYRIKQDAVPGRYSMIWFEAGTEGEDQVFCTEYCGKSHSNMLTKVMVESPEKFDKWLNEDEDKGKPLAEIGASLYEKKACKTCHTLDGGALVGPSFKGVYGRAEVMSSGLALTVDDDYIRESILNPTAKIVKGYQPQMPSYQGSLKDKQIEALIEFLKTVK